MHVHVLLSEPPLTHAAGVDEALAATGRSTTQDVLVGHQVADAAQLGHTLAARWRDGGPDVVFASGWLAGLAAQVATQEIGTPVVQRLFAPGRGRDRERLRLEGAVARSAACSVAVCSADVDRLVQHGLRRAAVRVVPHGVDTTVFNDRGPALAAADERRIVARPDTAHATTDRLVSMLPSLPSSELVLLTTSTTRPAAAGAVSRAISQHPVAGRVKLLDVTPESSKAPTLAALLRSADLAVVTGDDETDLDLALQAMACGVPLVAESVGATADIVADGVTGLLVPAASWEELGDAARTLLGDDMRRESLGFAAGDRARACFDWASMGPTLGDLLDEVVSTAPSIGMGAS